MTITFDDYMRQTRKTALYPDAGSGSMLALAYAGLGLGEAGEIQNQLKKVIRDDASQVTEKRRAAIKKELGDLCWYVARIADELDFSLGEVVMANLHKLNDRAERGVIQGSGDNR